MSVIFVPHCPYVFDSLNSDIWICIVLCSEFPKFCSFTCVSLLPLIDNTFEVLQRRWRGPTISVWMPTLALGYLVALLLPWDPGKNLTRNKNRNRIYNLLALQWMNRTPIIMRLTLSCDYLSKMYCELFAVTAQIYLRYITWNERNVKYNFLLCKWLWMSPRLRLVYMIVYKYFATRNFELFFQFSFVIIMRW